jgi:hypothetical protein
VRCAGRIFFRERDLIAPEEQVIEQGRVMRIENQLGVVSVYCRVMEQAPMARIKSEWRL